jgi:hypothetical protein
MKFKPTPHISLVNISPARRQHQHLSSDVDSPAEWIDGGRTVPARQLEARPCLPTRPAKFDGFGGGDVRDEFFCCYAKFFYV